MHPHNSISTGLETKTWFVIVLFLTFLAAGAGTASAAPEVTDLTISDAIEDELMLDRNVRAHLIDVATTDGIVTVSGVADNLLAKKRAGRIAQTVKGVRAVVNTIRVIPPILRSDAEIESDVKAALAQDPAADAYEIDVNVKDHVVTLSGTVDSWQERRLSETVATGVKGVEAIDNNIAVKHKERRPDIEIQQDIVQTLRWDVQVDDALIEVDVKNGKVELSGTVGSFVEKNRAIGMAYVANVESVDARALEVRLWARDPKLRGEKYRDLTDTRVADAVEMALLHDPRVAAFNVTPEATGGVVTLRGTVDNLKAKRAAVQTAGDTVGVVRVLNRLKVRPVEPFRDEDVERQIEEAFSRDPFVESFEISVTVRNGIVDLFGSVATVYEKRRAEDVASGVNGVIAVNNYIAVSSAYQPQPFDPFLKDWQVTANPAPRFEIPFRDYRNDGEIQEAIADEFFWSPFVDGEKIDISVSNGVATLTGTVGSWMEYRAAVDNAYEGGANIVNNQLKVQ